jgi:hypothetical protein
MAKHGRGESRLLKSAESLGRMIGALQRELEAISKPATKKKAGARQRSARKKTSPR